MDVFAGLKLDKNSGIFNCGRLKLQMKQGWPVE